MLIKLTEYEIDQYIDFAYHLSTDLSKSCYPTFADGIKTKDDFTNLLKKSFQKDHDEIYLFYYNERVEGLIYYYYLPEENYFSCLVFSIENHIEIAFQELLDHVDQGFKGYDFYFGCSIQNKEAIQKLLESSFSKIEESFSNVLFFKDYTLMKEYPHIKRVDEKNFNDFKRLHLVDDEMYWNSERLYEKINEWNIYLYYEDNQPVATIYYIIKDQMLEIFGIDYLNHRFYSKAMYELMIIALNHGKNSKSEKATYVLFFSNEEETNVLKGLGFNCIDTYQCFYRKI